MVHPVQLFVAAMSSTLAVLAVVSSGAIVVQRMTDGGQASLKGIVTVTALISLPCLLFSRLSSSLTVGLVSEAWPVLLFGALQVTVGVVYATILRRFGVVDSEYGPLLTLSMCSQNAVAYPYALLAAIGGVTWYNGPHDAEPAVIAARTAASLAYCETLVYVLNVNTSITLWTVGNRTVQLAAQSRQALLDGGTVVVAVAAEDGRSSSSSLASSLADAWRLTIRPALSVPVRASFFGIVFGLIPQLRWLVTEAPGLRVLAQGVARAGDACVPLTMIVLGCSLGAQSHIRRKRKQQAAAAATEQQQQQQQIQHNAAAAAVRPGVATTTTNGGAEEEDREVRPGEAAGDEAAGGGGGDKRAFRTKVQEAPLALPPTSSASGISAILAKKTPEPKATPCCYTGRSPTPAGSSKHNSPAFVPIEQDVRDSFTLPPPEEEEDGAADDDDHREGNHTSTSMGYGDHVPLAVDAASARGSGDHQPTSGGGLSRQTRYTLLVAFGRFVLMPVLGLLGLWAAGLRPTSGAVMLQDPNSDAWVIDKRRAMLLVLLVESFAPSAVNSGVICTLHDFYPERQAQLLAILYSVSAVPSVVWLFVGLWFLE